MKQRRAKNKEAICKEKAKDSFTHFNPVDKKTTLGHAKN